MTSKAGKSKAPVKKSNGKVEARARAAAVENAPPLTTSNSQLHEGTRVGPVYDGGFLHFSPFDLTRYELAQQRVMGALQAVGLKNAAIELRKRAFEEELRTLSADAGVLVQEAQKQQQGLLNLQQELAGIYELDFSKVTYDDISGRIFLLGEPVPEEGST